MTQLLYFENAMSRYQKNVLLIYKIPLLYIYRKDLKLTKCKMKVYVVATTIMKDNYPFFTRFIVRFGF